MAEEGFRRKLTAIPALMSKAKVTLWMVIFG